MTVSEHPELEQLKNYLNNSASAEFSGLRLHLAQCSQCRALIDGLTGLEQVSQQVLSMQTERDTLSEQQHQKIADYIDGRLSGDEHLQIKEFLQLNPLAMKAALHYASHSSAMDKAGLESTTDTISVATTGMAVNLWSGFMKKVNDLMSFQTPVWLTVPVTAVLVAMLSVTLLDQSPPEQSKYLIASYQDNAVIQFRPKDHLPGIGFFNNTTELSEAYANLKVPVSEDRHFRIQWPAVAQAINYTFRLHMFSQGSKLLVGEVTTEKTSVVISTKLDDINHRYKWVLSGETSDHRVFSTNGGFVINNLEKGVLR